MPFCGMAIFKIIFNVLRLVFTFWNLAILNTESGIIRNLHNQNTMTIVKFFKNTAAVLLVLSALIYCGCNDEQKPGFVTLYFDHNVGGELLEFEKLEYTSRAGHPFSVVRMKYYVSNITLHGTDGSTFEIKDVHYRDAAEPDTRSFSSNNVPSGTYDKISFIYGLDEATNVDGGLANTQTNINMEWPIPGDQGYHYMKFEGKYDSLDAGVIKNFNLHFGAAMGNQNFIEISLPLTPFSVDDNTWGVYLEMDINEWLENPNVWDFETFGPMIMMNQDAQETLKENGATVFSIEKVIEE